MADVLLEEVNPNGNIQAVVEADEQVCFFYLYGAQDSDFETASVWVRNHIPAPPTLDASRMNAGLPPANPAAHCRHKQGAPPLQRDELRVVWLPEGNGAALYEGDELLAIIPPWSGFEGFAGYARDCIGDGPVAWELAADNVLVERFADAELYWQQWDDDTLWPSIQSRLLSRIEPVLGKHANYYAIDQEEWPPKAIVRIPRPEGVVLVTIGVSVRPQPNVEMSTDAPELLRRIELGVLLPPQWSDDAVKRFAKYVSGQSNLPWSCYTWLGPGHTLPCDAWQNGDFRFALLSPRHPALPGCSLAPLFDDPVNILWFLPISAAERQLAIEGGSERLAKSLPPRRWAEA